MCGAGPPYSSAAGSVPPDTIHSRPSLNERVFLDHSLGAGGHSDAVTRRKQKGKEKQPNQPLQHLSMSSEEWSQELILAWWTDACLVRVALCMRWMRKDDTHNLTQHIPKADLTFFFPPCKRPLGQLTFLSESLREGEDVAWGWKRCFSWGYIAISFCRNRR